jgi:tetratricopeptide (TPR) repeat protein
MTPRPPSMWVGETERPTPPGGVNPPWPPLPRRPWIGALGILWLVLAASPARADVGKLQSEVTDLENQAKNLAVGYKVQASSREQLAENRLVDAQVLYNLKDYTRAAILLLDYVNKYKDTRGFPEALFFLADSLYNKRDFLSANRYFQQIVNEVKGRYYQEALQRLVELSLITGDTADVETHLNALAAIPPNLLVPSVPYVRGKYYFFKDQLDVALAAFRSIPPGHKYYSMSQYFIGAALVKRKDFAGATQVFEALLKTEPKTESENQVRDLTYMALGRLLYEKGQISKAIDMYQKISRRSTEFDTSLYEICWAYVKAGEFKKALRALELLALAHPDSNFIPEVRVLQGNLLIRLEQWGQATDLFSKTREKFVPVYTRMKQVMTEHADPNVFFDLLLQRNQGSLAMQVQVPPLAVAWVKESANVKRALNLVGDVRDIQASIKEATDLIKQLERAINSPAKIKIFPEFASAKAKHLEVENRLVLARRDVLDGEVALVMPAASSAEKDEIRNFAAKRNGVEKQLKELPTSVEGYESRQKRSMKKLETLDEQLNHQSILIDSLRAQLVASEKYFNDTAGSKDKAVHQTFKKEVDAVRTMIEELQSEADDLTQAITTAKSSAGVGGPEEVAERGVKAQYREALAKEHQFLATLRGRLSGGAGGEFDTLAQLLGRCDRVDELLTSFDKRLEEGVEEKLQGIRTTLTEEKTHLGGYGTELAEYKTQTDQAAGAITYDGFREVASRFYEIVVRADVGIIDVAWALKDTKSKEVSRLVRQQKMDLKLLDDEFRDVLRED